MLLLLLVLLLLLLLRRRSTYVGSAEFVTQNFKFTSDPRQRMIKNGAIWGRGLKEGEWKKKGKGRKGKEERGKEGKRKEGTRSEVREGEESSK